MTRNVTLEMVRAAMREDLLRSGLRESDLYAEPSLTDLRGHAKPGYFLRYPDASTGKPNGHARYRYLPDLFRGFALKTAENCPKYDQPAGDVHAYFSQLMHWPEILEDPSRNLFLPEGEKKSAAACKAGYAAIGLGGIWNWKVAGAEKDQLIPDLAAIKWKDRRVFLVCDSDARSNQQVRKGLDRLCIVLTNSGAKVYSIILPELKPGEKTGLDDFLLTAGKAGFDELIAAAEEFIYVLRSELLHVAVRKCERILAGGRDYKLFLHGTELARVVEQDREPELSAALRRPKGSTYLAPLRADNVEFLLSASGRVFDTFVEKPADKKDKAKKWPVSADPKWPWCRQVIANVQTFPEQVPWRRLHLVTHTPLLLANGDIVSAPGYHAETSVWFDPRGVKFPEIPPNPTKEQAQDALTKFAQVYKKFPFAKTGEETWNRSSSYATVLATILSILIRHLLPTVPMLGVTAPEAGSGKTKIAESIAVAATGCMPTRISYDSTEEFEKLLPAALRAGERTLLIDNVDKKWVNSPKLAQVLTTDEPTDFRVLGESRTVKVPNRGVIMTTGNQLIISGDLPRRSLSCRLVPEKEQPETRMFDFDPVVRAGEMFPELVSAGLTVLRYYFRADCPEPNYKHGSAQSGSFEEWNRRVRGLLVHLEFGDPLEMQKEIRGDNPVLQEEVSLLRALRVFFDKEFLSEEVKGVALKYTCVPTPTPPKKESERQKDARLRVEKEQRDTEGKARDELRSAFMNSEGHWDTKAVGYRLRALRDRRLDGLQLRVVGSTHGLARYCIEGYRK